MDDQTSWREQRREAAAAQAAALEQRKALETAQARELLADFIRQLQKAGVQPQPLRAQVVGSGTSYRTNVTGWYLRRNRSIGLDAEGNYYLLGTAPSLKARIAGLQIAPSDPPLIVGVGARDGESVPLKRLLSMRLEEMTT